MICAEVWARGWGTVIRREKEMCASEMRGGNERMRGASWGRGGGPLPPRFTIPFHAGWDDSFIDSATR